MSLLNNPSLCVTPNSGEAGKLFSIIPTNGAGDLDVVRATTATRVNSAGLIETVGNNIARLDYTNGSCPSILVEPQRTNLVFPSATATTQSRTVTATAHTLSFYGTGTVVLSGVATGTLVGTGINNKVSLTFTATAGSLILTVTGSVVNWQLEAGSNATSYIPTTSATVTRNADVISKTGISSLIGQTEGSIYVEFERTTETAGFKNLLILYGDNPLTNHLWLITYSGIINLILQITINSTTYQRNISLLLGKNKLLLIYDTTGCDIFLNGVKLTRLSLEGFPSLYNLQLMNYGGGRQYGSGYLFSFWKTKLTDEEAIQLTTL